VSGDVAVLWLLRRDRIVVATALLAIVVLAWAYLLFGIGRDMPMGLGDDMMPMPWTSATFGIVLGMWVVMMIAMMLPSAARMILLFAAIDRRKASSPPYPAAGLFALAYLVVWVAFGIAATSTRRERSCRKAP